MKSSVITNEAIITNIDVNVDSIKFIKLSPFYRVCEYVVLRSLYTT